MEPTRATSPSRPGAERHASRSRPKPPAAGSDPVEVTVTGDGIRITAGGIQWPPLDPLGAYGVLTGLKANGHPMPDGITESILARQEAGKR